MTELTNDAIGLLAEMISIPSFSRDESAVADFLERYIESRGYVASRSGNNVWMLSPGFDPARPTVLLNSHIDTVKPVAGWKRDPFTPKIENEHLYGLGSNDAGASVVSLLHAYFYLTQQQQTYNLIFAATAEEEVSGSNGIESLIRELPKIDFAVVGEPTGMHLAIAEKGLMVLDCVAHGVAGHAARNEGENAIYKALQDIEWFSAYQFPEVSDLLGPVKMSVTMINAGTQHNVVPDKCSFVVDVRSNEKYSNQQLLAIIKEHVNSNVSARSTRLSSSATPQAHPFVQRAQELNRKLFGSPTLSDQALMPFISVKVGPGDSARSHTADEYIILSEIDEAITLYIELLNDLSLGL
jgi:acetylornithine deacetylase